MQSRKWKWKKEEKKKKNDEKEELNDEDDTKLFEMIQKSYLGKLDFMKKTLLN